MRKFFEGFCQFRSEFFIVPKTGFSAEIPINRERICVRVLTVESINIITIIDAEMGHNGRRSIFYEIICVIGT